MAARRGYQLRPPEGLLLALAMHLLLYWAVLSIEPGRAFVPLQRWYDPLRCKGIALLTGRCRVEIIEIEPPPPPEPEPPAPEAPPPELPPPPPPKAELKPKPKVEPPPQAAPPPPAPAQTELPADMVLKAGEGIGVTVKAGTEARAGSVGGSLEGDPKGKPGGVQGGVVGGKPGSAGTGPPWAPKGELFLSRLALPTNVPKLDCPASKSEGVSGEVILRVQVRRDGSVRDVKVVKGIGHGCDEIARKAIRQGKYKPAVGTDGQAADSEFRFTYEFRVEG